MDSVDQNILHAQVLNLKTLWTRQGTRIAFSTPERVEILNNKEVNKSCHCLEQWFKENSQVKEEAQHRQIQLMSRNRDIIFLYLWCKYCGISDPKLGLKFKYLEHSSQLKIECWMNLQVFLREFFLLHGFEAFVNSQLLECRETVSALCLSTTNSVTKNALRSSSAF